MPVPEERIFLTELELCAAAYEQMFEETEKIHISNQILRAFTLRIDPELKDALIPTKKAAHQFGFSVDVSEFVVENRDGEPYQALTFINQRPPLGS